ncbi:MAG: L-histidine N(alpha)-methyltransferase [Pyrinomonadaceae bacterium MAG19_C2-C3]|nr:L-histidine N(alpha)-methyltransferase [Pyrinomonadaceae bacterium MAG19_C2-C3]
MLSSENMPAERLTIHHLGVDSDAAEVKETDNQFAADVRQGLSSTPKTLYPKYFYDELGSQLFDAICLLPEYYLTRAEEEILSEHADTIVRAAKDIAPADDGGDVRLALMEFGSGSAIKTQRIIEAALRVQSELVLTSIDISVSALERAARVLLQLFPNLSLTALAGDYDAALDFLHDTQPHLAHDATHKDTARPRTLALFLGSNIGNFNYDEAIAFLRRLRLTMRDDDALLLGADLRKDPKILEAAYDDALGVTAAFNLNILVRINRELGADFKLENFRHLARYDDVEGSVKIYIESKREQIVHLKGLEMEVSFAEGERIHTENSHKYDHATLSAMARETGFDLAQTWLDHDAQFSSNLFVAGN